MHTLIWFVLIVHPRFVSENFKIISIIYLRKQEDTPHSLTHSLTHSPAAEQFTHYLTNHSLCALEPLSLESFR